MKLAKANSTTQAPEEPKSEQVATPLFVNSDGPTAEDLFIQWLMKNWQQVALVVLAAFLGYYIYDNFRASREVKMRSAADLFGTVRGDYDNYVRVTKAVAEKQAALATGGEAAKTELASLEKERAAAKQKLIDHIAPMYHTDFPYSKLATFYTGLISRLDGDTADFRDRLREYRMFDKYDVATPDRFFAETANLVLARTLIDDDASLAEGRELLVELARRGLFVNVSAAITLSRISANEEEGREALEVLNGIRANQSEQASIVKSEIDRLSAAYPPK